MKTYRLERALPVAFATWLALATISLFGYPHSASQVSPKEDELEKLLNTIRDTNLQETDPNRVIKAIQRLGELRDPAAVDDLVPLLTFRRWYPWEKDPHAKIDAVEPIGPSTRYPAVGALMDIGKPSLPALIKVIENHEPHSLETENAMHVVTYLSRDKRPEYIDYLKEAANKAPTPQAAERLSKAAEMLKESKR